jgi:acetyl-CoA synthetase
MSETGISVFSGEGQLIAPFENFQKQAHIRNLNEYETMYRRSLEEPENFWAEMADKNLDWYKKWDKVLEYNFQKPQIKWFLGGKLNVSYNCLDRHLKKRANQAAIIWEADGGEYRTFTYYQLYREVNRFANVLKKYDVKKGDRVTIYLPMIPELVVTMLACARIGAIHSIVFGGFSPHALRDRINDCESSLVITADDGIRGGKKVPLKTNSDAAVEECPSVRKVIVVQRSMGDVPMDNGRDVWYHKEMAARDIDNYCEPEKMDAEDPLFILYTSGSTGKPKGVLHTTAGYLLYTNLTFRYIFDYQEGETWFCTADIGWVTGHSYITYGPLSNGATSLMFEGIPTYPDAGRFWDIVDKHQVNSFYTAPTAIRALMRAGEEVFKHYDLSSLKLLGSVGEPINPEVWLWYFRNVGKSKIPIVDTWWQTETGGILITPLAGAMTLKPGSACRPFFGISPKILKEDGTEAGVNEGGYLVIDKPWPGMIRGTYGDPEQKRVKEVYFERFPNFYMTGDGARKDENGDYWLMGRIDDVINISGHRIGTAEIESALVSHEKVAEAAVVGFPHEIKGEGIYAYVTLKTGVEATDKLRKELLGHVRIEISPIASPDKMQFAPALPKTRSGKIMRRILRKIAHGDVENLGDTSTLAEPHVVDDLLKNRL